MSRYLGQDGIALCRGSRVTEERKTWYDGAPVESWPNPHYIGTVLRLDSFHGCRYARVKRDVAKHAEWVNVDRLSTVPREEVSQ